MRTKLISWFMIFTMLTRILAAIAFDLRNESVEEDHVRKVSVGIDENAQGLGVEVVHAKKGAQGGSDVYKKPQKSKASQQIRYWPVNLAQSVSFCAWIIVNYFFLLA